jgi:hypothetical protein
VRALQTDAAVDPSTVRADVVRARSRMRTKHGGRDAIAWLNDHLEVDDELLHLARTREVAGAADGSPGVVALTGRQVVYVADTLRPEHVLHVPLPAIEAVGWTRSRRVGDLTVATRRSEWEFRSLAAGDLREFVDALAELVPAAVHQPAPGALTYL